MAIALRSVQEADVHALLARRSALTENELAVLYRHFKPSLTAYAARKGASDPEGVANLSIFDGFAALERLENRTEPAFKVYLLRVARSYVSRDHLGDNMEPRAIDDDALTVGDDMEELTDRLWLREAVDRLPEAQREVIIARFLDDMSGVDTGAMLGKEPNSVYQLQHRALKSLRRAAFGGLLALLVLVAVVVVREALEARTGVDTAPIDRTTESTPRPSSTTISTPSSLPLDAAPLAEEDASGDGRGGGEVGAVGPEQLPNGTDTTEQDEVEASPPTTSPANRTTLPQTTGVTPTSVSTTEPPNPPTTAPPVPATPLNICAPHLINLTTSAFKLYNPGGAGSRSASFAPPAAVRFLDAQGTAVHVIDTSGPMRTSSQPGSHGWVGAGDGTGTYASFEAAPNPTYWAVLATDAQIVGTVTVETLDPATGTWIAVPGCG